VACAKLIQKGADNSDTADAENIEILCEPRMWRPIRKSVALCRWLTDLYFKNFGFLLKAHQNFAFRITEKGKGRQGHRISDPFPGMKADDGREET